MAKLRGSSNSTLHPFGPFARNADGSFPLRMDGGPGTSDPTRLTYVNLTLKRLLMTAFGVGDHDIVGPSWLDSERYVIEAKVPAGSTKEQANRMLQGLLTERFRMTIDREKRNVSFYELTVLKQGSKLRPSIATSGAQPENDRGLRQSGLMLPEDKDGFLVLPSGWSLPGGFPFQFGDRNGASHAVGSGVTISELLSFLEFQLGSSVVDKTGLTGTYDYNLEYAQIVPAAGNQADSAPDFITAVRDQLGLKLKSTKGPVEVLVIERAERTPTQN